ncbi:MAG: hypothetical protein V5A62_10735 [Haloarculaceae archaeon]
MESETMGEEYDLLLAGIPAPVAGGALVGLYSSLPFLLAFAAGGVLAAGLVGMALFLVPP